MHRAMDRLLTKEYKEGIEKDEEQSLTRCLDCSHDRMREGHLTSSSGNTFRRLAQCQPCPALACLVIER